MFRLLLRYDWYLVILSLFLLGMGLLTLYSLSVFSEGTDYFFKQAVFSVIGLGAMFFVASLDYRHIARYGTGLYLMTLVVLGAVLVFGVMVRGTAGWLSLGPVQVQPVEFAKIALIIFLARFISKKTTELGEWTRVIVSSILTMGLMVLVLQQPDLGSSLVLAAIWAGMITASGLRLKHFIVLGMLGIVLASASWFSLAEYQKDRLVTFIHPEQDPRGSGYNVLQAMVAVGSGGWSGKGIGSGSQSQLNFLPEKHTDFIFAVITEELGLWGALMLIGLYLGLLYRIRSIGQAARDNFGYLIAVGVLVMISFQSIVNIGMNVGLLPVTGLPLPLVSYGGSSLLSVLIALGLLLSIHRRRQETKDMHIASLDRSMLLET